MDKLNGSHEYIRFLCSDDKWKERSEEALRYAIISVPFTINRMGISGLEKRIFNILKGKLSELLFSEFAKSHVEEIDFRRCQTPFYDVDRRDFLFKGEEWDIKNNFLTSQKLQIESTTLEKLPALIPNNFKGDQWDKRNRCHFPQSGGSKILFSFMVSRLEDGPLITEWANFQLNKDQLNWLNSLNQKFQGKHQNKSPFSEDWFWNHWDQLSLPWEQVLKVNFYSPIYITSYAGEDEWSIFRETAPRSFSGGMIRTRITNMCCPIGRLPALKQLLES